MKSESEVVKSCPTLSDLMDYSLPGSSVHGIFQARVLEWGAITFSEERVLEVQILGSHGRSVCVCVCVCVCVRARAQLSDSFVTPPARLLCPWNSLGKNT